MTDRRRVEMPVLRTLDISRRARCPHSHTRIILDDWTR